MRFASGILASLVVFVPTTLLSMSLRRLQERDARTSLGEKALALHFVDNRLMSTHNVLSQWLLDWRLPWWFQFPIYILMGLGWLLCFYVTILYGVTFTDDEANAWLVSFVISIASSILLLQSLTALLFGLISALGGERITATDLAPPSPKANGSVRSTNSNPEDNASTAANPRRSTDTDQPQRVSDDGGGTDPYGDYGAATDLYRNARSVIVVGS